MSEQHVFSIEHIFLIASHFTASEPVYRLQEKWEPSAGLQLDVKSQAVSDEQYEVNVIIEVGVKLKDKEVFKLSVQQGGSFIIKGYTEAEIKHLTESFCASILYPYARQKVSDLVISAGFPPLHLSPIDFETRFREMNKAAEEKE